MSSTSLPTHIHHLSDLSQLPPGAKVRFLGCVIAYDTEGGHLYLQSPTQFCQQNVKLSEEQKEGPFSGAVVAELEIDLIREDLRESDTAVGTWLNVVGYVKTVAKSKSGLYKPKVQALATWDARSVNIEAYSEALNARNRIFGSLVS